MKHLRRTGLSYSVANCKLTKHKIFGVQRMCASKLSSDLAVVWHVEADTALSLRLVHDRIQLAERDHGLHHLHARLLVQLQLSKTRVSKEALHLPNKAGRAHKLLEDLATGR